MRQSPIREEVWHLKIHLRETFLSRNVLVYLYIVLDERVTRFILISPYISSLRYFIRFPYLEKLEHQTKVFIFNSTKKESKKGSAYQSA